MAYQPDLFRPDPQSAPREDQPERLYSADPERVRAKLHLILSEARAASSMPWERPKLALYRTIFPQMTNWLPEDEARQLCFDFEAELARLEAA